MGTQRYRTPSDQVTHGSRTMYSRHLREGSDPCPECRKANAEYHRRYTRIRMLKRQIKTAESRIERQRLEREMRALLTPRQYEQWKREQIAKTEKIIAEMADLI